MTRKASQRAIALTNQALLQRARCSPQINQIEAIIAECPQVEFPVTHRFTPGLYIREIFMPAGSILTSKIHRTEHPFIVSKGRVSVYTEGSGVEELIAPYTGITKPGTRRALHVHEDTIWTTFHPTEKTDLVEIERDIIEPHEIGRLETAGIQEAMGLLAVATHPGGDV